MSKRVKPKAEHRIVDGEVVTAEIDEKIKRGREFSAQKANHSENDEIEFEDDKTVSQDPDSILNDVDPDKTLVEEMPQPSFFKRHTKTVIGLFLFGILIAVIWYSRPSLDWQVEKINDLQREVANLQEQNQLMQEQFQEQKAAHQDLIVSKIEELKQSELIQKPPVQSESNQPLINETKLQELKDEFAEQLQALQTQITNRTGNAGEEVSSALSELNAKAESLLPEATEKLQALEEGMQSKFSELSQELDALMRFKSEQEAANAELEAESNKEPKTALLTESQSPLSSLQIQQWIIEINTQWMLNGRVQETRGQLLALEQAASLSEFQYTSQLARMIGQDLTYIEQLGQKQTEALQVNTQALKKSISQLKLETINSSEEAGLTISESSQTNQDGIDNLLNKFSQLISVKKRDEGESLSQVNKLLLNDVLKQRLTLLADRLDWGLATRSESIVEQTVQDFKGFIQSYYPEQSAEFSRLLAPFNDIKFNAKQPLSITRLDEEIAS